MTAAIDDDRLNETLPHWLTPPDERSWPVSHTVKRRSTNSPIRSR
jgi:hypothetical protein